MIHFLFCILLLLIQQTLSSPIYCPQNYCWTGINNCTLSQPGTPCVRCNGGYGYVDSNGNCIYEVQTFQPNITTLISYCNNNLQLCQDQTGKCLPCKYGIRARECSYYGYVKNALECACYSSQLDPLSLCKQVLPPLIYWENSTANISKVTCTPFRNKQLGFFATPTQSISYGTSNPLEYGIPNSCYSSIYGPEPGVLTNELSTSPLFTCNTYAYPDPGTPNISSPVTCAGHGFWDSINYQCICDLGYSAIPIGLDYYNQTAYVCAECWGFRGPDPDYPDGYCQAIYAPDPVDGGFKLCSGHGIYSEGQCYCYSNSTAGFWQLSKIQALFNYRLGNGTEILAYQSVETCIACKTGYELPDCLFINGYTNPPTDSPTTSLPTNQPTQSPIQICNGCPLKYQKDSSYLSTISITNFTSIQSFFNDTTNNTTKCESIKNPVNMILYLDGYLNISFANNATNYTMLQDFGAILCSEILSDICMAWEWIYFQPFYTYFFYSFADILVYGGDTTATGTNCYL